MTTRFHRAAYLALLTLTLAGETWWTVARYLPPLHVLTPAVQVHRVGAPTHRTMPAPVLRAIDCPEHRRSFLP
jgi:hypothetical protein